MLRRLFLALVALLCPATALAGSFPDLREFAHALPGASWTHPPARIELGYVRPYDLPQLHGSHLGVHQELVAGTSLQAQLEWLRAGPVEHRRPRIGLRWRRGGVGLGVSWFWETVQVEGHRPSRRSRVQAHLWWRWGPVRVAGRWQPSSRGEPRRPSPAELVLGLCRGPWEMALRRRPAPWRDASEWEGGLLAAVDPTVKLGLRLRSEDASLHLVWSRPQQRVRLAFTVDGPRARGLALTVEWGR